MHYQDPYFAFQMIYILNLFGVEQCIVQDYTKNYTKPTIFYTNYMLYEDAIIIRVIRRIVFQSFCVDFPVTFLEIMKIL